MSKELIIFFSRAGENYTHNGLIKLMKVPVSVLVYLI